MKFNLLLILVLQVAMVSCGYNENFTDKEIIIINEGNSITPFRILLTTNDADSIILRTSSKKIKNITDDEDLKLLIDRLKVTLYIEDGAGIAAPQVGILKNIFLFIKRGDSHEEILTVVINPKIINKPSETICFKGDGCLSIPETTGNSVRYPWIEVEYYNEKGELIREKLEGYSRETGFDAVVFQHEYDHLQGVLFTDKLCEE